jgi:hypothetical protein
VILLELIKGARVSDMEGNEGEEVEMVLGRIVRMIKEKVQLLSTPNWDLAYRSETQKKKGKENYLSICSFEEH